MDHQDEYDSLRVAYKIPVPQSLRQILIDDNAAIVGEKLIGLPCTPTVRTLLGQYLVKTPSLDFESGQIILDLAMLFNSDIGLHLLYREERRQYKEVLKNSKEVQMCDVYGGVHFLRLMVKLPVLMSKANLSEEAIVKIKEVVLGLIAFLEKHKNIFFTDTYEPSPLHNSEKFF